MILLIFGPPGSGKGTQITELAEKFELTPIPSPGDLFRKINDDEIKKYTSTGKLVPDELVAKLIFGEIGDKDNFILDGYPRNLNQAETLENFLKEKNKRLDYVVYLKVSEEEIVARISNRRVCSKCGRNYNLITNPPIDNKCGCGGELTLREDDKEDVIRTRLTVFNEQTQPLLEFYKDRLITVDGEQNIQNVFENICKELEK